jgi:hypothetical protein
MKVRVTALQDYICRFKSRGEVKVIQPTEAEGDSLGSLQQASDGLHQTTAQFDFHVGTEAGAMAFVGSRQITEAYQTRALNTGEP